MDLARGADDEGALRLVVPKKEELAEAMAGVIESARTKADEETVDDLLDLVDRLAWEYWVEYWTRTVGEPPAAKLENRALAALFSRVTGSDRAKELVEELHARQAERQRRVLGEYAAWEAERAVEDNDPAHLVRGLVALALAGIEDPQDPGLVLIGRSARLAGIRREEVFEQAAALVGEPAASILREYAREAPQETDRVIEELGNLEVRDDEGFGYRTDLGKTGWL